MSQRGEWQNGEARGVVQSIQIGRVQTHDGVAHDGTPTRLWTSAIVKAGVAGPVEVGPLGILGDEQADLKHHGGPEKAILAYAAGHYAAWIEAYPAHGFAAGGFGENLTMAGIAESDCCIGDVIRLGSTLLQVTQPRQPCWKLSRLWGIAQFAVQVQNSGRTGWYLRVLETGRISPGDEATLVERPFSTFTVTYANAVMHGRPHDRDADLELAACPALATSWQTTLRRRAAGEELPSPLRRLEGNAAQ